MAEQPVYSDAQVDFGNYITLQFYVSGGNLINAVPPNKILDIATLTLNYFPIPKRHCGSSRHSGAKLKQQCCLETSDSLRRTDEDPPSALSERTEVRGGWVCANRFYQ
jgi:hypothetical protein